MRSEIRDRRREKECERGSSREMAEKSMKKAENLEETEEAEENLM